MMTRSVARRLWAGAGMALLPAIALTAAAGAQSPQSAAPQVRSLPAPGVRASDDATRIAADLCTEIWATKDEAAIKRLVGNMHESTDSSREAAGDAQGAASAAAHDMLAGKVVRQDMLDKLRRANENALGANARWYAAQAVESLIEPCAADRRAGEAIGVSSGEIGQAALDQAVTELQPVFRRLSDNLILIDQALRLRIANGALTAPQADVVLREWAAALALRDLSHGPDAALVAEYRGEAQTYLQGLQRLVPTVTKWPTDRTPEEYLNLSRAMLQQVGEQYTADFARGFVPSSELVEAQFIAAWTRGERDVIPARDLFNGQPVRLLRAIASAMPALPKMAPAPAATEPAEKGCHGFAGTWRTNYGDVVLKVTVDQVEGDNPSYRAKLTGRVIGQTFEGVRSLPGYADTPVKFTLATNGGSFDGIVELAPGHTIAWTGTCAPATPLF